MSYALSLSLIILSTVFIVTVQSGWRSGRNAKTLSSVWMYWFGAASLMGQEARVQTWFQSSDGCPVFWILRRGAGVFFCTLHLLPLPHDLRNAFVFWSRTGLTSVASSIILATWRCFVFFSRAGLHLVILVVFFLGLFCSHFVRGSVMF